ncbi:MAG: phage Gp37/Gp68 family protein [Candidatus Glassbacteria bacterium]
MANNTKIEWTQSTWNPITGCTKISPGCENCYAEKMAIRLKAMRQPNYRNGFELSLHPESISLPLAWKKPQVIFVNSMSDIFHTKVPESFILDVFNTMSKAYWHTFQVLTKRSKRLLDLNTILGWRKNIWMGVSVECQDFCYRIDNLKFTDAEIKFVSFEPLLGPIGYDLSGIDWVIVGGESGPKARKINYKWVQNLRDQCLDLDIPFYFKQWGGFNKKKNGRELCGMVWDQMPVIL